MNVNITFVCSQQNSTGYLSQKRNGMVLYLPHCCHENKSNYWVEQIVPELQWRLDIKLKTRRQFNATLMKRAS